MCVIYLHVYMHVYLEESRYFRSIVLEASSCFFYVVHGAMVRSTFGHEIKKIFFATLSKKLMRIILAKH